MKTDSKEDTSTKPAQPLLTTPSSWIERIGIGRLIVTFAVILIVTFVVCASAVMIMENAVKESSYYKLLHAFDMMELKVDQHLNSISKHVHQHMTEMLILKDHVDRAANLYVANSCPCIDHMLNATLIWLDQSDFLPRAAQKIYEFMLQEHTYPKHPSEST